MSTESLDTVRLDDIPETEGIEMIKIDIQGGELAAFRGAAGKLSAALCVQTEVAMVPIYRDQPLFSDQNACLSDFGLRFFGFASANRFPFSGTPSAHSERMPPSRRRMSPISSRRLITA